MNGVFPDFGYWLNSNILVSSEGTKMQKNLYFYILCFYAVQVCFLLRKNESNPDNKNHHDV